MATATIGQYQDPPLIRYGHDEKFINHARLNLTDNRLMVLVTTSARPEVDFINAGIHISTNRGQPPSTSIPNGEFVYFGDVADIQGATGGSKPFNQYSREEVYQIVANITARYPGGLLMACDEAQENEGPWQWHDEQARQQIEWYHMAWLEYKNRTPNFRGYYGPYSGSVNPVTFQNKDDVAQALTSPAAAYAFLSRRELEFYKCHYWSQGHWKYRGPLINMYIHQMSSKHLVMSECVLAIRLHQLALQHVGRDPHDMLIFVWTDSASGLSESYTERYIRPVQGGTLFGHNFPGWDAENMMQIARYAFEHGRIVFNWLDTYLNGSDTNIVPPDIIRDDGYLLQHYDGNGATRTASAYNPSPFRPATVGAYPCGSKPHAGQDMASLGGWWHCQSRALVNAEPQPVPFRQNGEPFIATDWSTYYVRYWREGLPLVEAANVGNMWIVHIYDLCGRFCTRGIGQMDLLLGGVPVTLVYKRGVHNQIPVTVS